MKQGKYQLVCIFSMADDKRLSYICYEQTIPPINSTLFVKYTIYHH